MTPAAINRRVKVEGRWVHSRRLKPTNRGDVRWVVVYRVPGGRSRRPRYAGTFTRESHAQARAQAINALLAEGRYDEVRRLTAGPAPGRTVRDMLDLALELTPSPSPAQTNRFKKARATLGLTGLGDLPVDEVGLADVQRWVNAAAERYAPATVHQYLTPIRQALDHAELGRTNPARDARLRLPLPAEGEEFLPPTLAEFEAICAAIFPRHLPLLRFLERTGLRMKEATSIEWGDIDWTGHRLRVARERTKGRTGGQRFVPMTGQIEQMLMDLRPPEDRRGAIFPVAYSTFGQAMASACRNAGVPTYSPHDLRGRFISLMLIAGVPVEMAARVAGHRRTSMTLDSYSHVVLDEPRWRLDELRHAVSVMFGMGGNEKTPLISPANEGGDVGMGSTGIESPKG